MGGPDIRVDWTTVHIARIATSIHGTGCCSSGDPRPAGRRTGATRGGGDGRSRQEARHGGERLGDLPRWRAPAGDPATTVIDSIGVVGDQRAQLVAMRAQCAPVGGSERRSRPDADRSGRVSTVRSPGVPVSSRATLLSALTTTEKYSGVFRRFSTPPSRTPLSHRREIQQTGRLGRLGIECPL